MFLISLFEDQAVLLNPEAITGPVAVVWREKAGDQIPEICVRPAEPELSQHSLVSCTL